jgi:aldose 1-epimerase
MSNPKQSAFTFLPLGGIIQEFRVAGINIVQGFRTQEDYVKHNAPFFGATIGRTSNRLKDAVINNLNGETYTFAKNNGPNSLHGGTVGWGKQIFDGPTAVQRHGKEAISFKYLSKDGDENYPGTVELRVWYTESKGDGGDPSSPNAKIILDIEYEVEFIGDECEETAVSITNHRYDVSLFLYSVFLSFSLSLCVCACACLFGCVSPFVYILFCSPLFLRSLIRAKHILQQGERGRGEE